MSLSQLARSIKESATLKLNETAALLREKGEPVIHLGGGERKDQGPLSTPSSNCASLLNTGDVRYTPPDGIPALKKAIIPYTEEHYKEHYKEDRLSEKCDCLGQRQAGSDGPTPRHPRSEGRSRLPSALLHQRPRDDRTRGRRSSPGYGRRWQFLSDAQKHILRIDRSVRFP
jgi:hypothetical protein